MTDVPTDAPDLDYAKREELARLDQIHADIAIKLQQRAFEPWKLVFAGCSAAAALMGSGAAIFAAGAGWMKLIGGH